MGRGGHSAATNPFGGFHLESVLMQQVRVAECKCQLLSCPTTWHSPFSQGPHPLFLSHSELHLLKKEKKVRKNKKTMHQVPVILRS